jgi:hypothetical protein
VQIREKTLFVSVPPELYVPIKKLVVDSAASLLSLAVEVSAVKPHAGIVEHLPEVIFAVIDPAPLHVTPEIVSVFPSLSTWLLTVQGEEEQTAPAELTWNPNILEVPPPPEGVSQVNVPSAAMSVTKSPAPQAVGFAASAVAVEALPESAAVMVPAEKFPDPSRATIALFVFDEVAVVAAFGMLEHVRFPFAAIAEANSLLEQSEGFAAKAVAVGAFVSQVYVPDPLSFHQLLAAQGRSGRVMVFSLPRVGWARMFKLPEVAPAIFIPGTEK